VLNVSDTASHRRDQIANLAELLTDAPTRQALVRAVYFGKKSFKTVVQLGKALDITPKRVTEIGKPLANLFFGQSKVKENGKNGTAYFKIAFVQHNLKKILSLAGNRRKHSQYHTKTNPRGTISAKVLKLKIPFKPVVRSVTVDDIDEFAKVRSIKNVPPTLSPERLPEARFKRGIIALLGDAVIPKDWGGEANDIFTTRIKIKSRRYRAAFALKGPAKKGPLVPGMMGKHGDQIQRLFTSPAQVFIVQYEGEIKESVVDLMSRLALAKATTEREVWFGIIDKIDSYRLRIAYPKPFAK
jgi:hypothetical protein